MPAIELKITSNENGEKRTAIVINHTELKKHFKDVYGVEIKWCGGVDSNCFHIEVNDGDKLCENIGKINKYLDSILLEVAEPTYCIRENLIILTTCDYRVTGFDYKS